MPQADISVHKNKAKDIRRENAYCSVTCPYKNLIWNIWKIYIPKQYGSLKLKNSNVSRFSCKNSVATFNSKYANIAIMISQLKVKVQLLKMGVQRQLSICIITTTSKRSFFVYVQDRGMSLQYRTWLAESHTKHRLTEKIMYMRHLSLRANNQEININATSA